MPDLSRIGLRCVSTAFSVCVAFLDTAAPLDTVAFRAAHGARPLSIGNP
ncbi:hypothetical protein HOU02_gp155 [Caulobacter phage CcrBL9]|uniref:Uncharacterized protein n=1 Tax=Caulobacter phage CcrBL9 TaxID=2283270 RepID=A0A385ED34_9CAUD|nr:hypothetical protein HOU02_gp030 [Caulobacter phage CcrBL9]YP_009810200.1 hypothetical protein HOU02_gp155 [Caulobacter phage CcrBL9]AXQ69054.1 hypothetical protein CcrBL9_gp030c [Caulobacter phage CcrBL9]AXQ69570.1 hypothetical protein CcrBL9_gp546c [Caulobacter phage CcrBL9]